MDIIASLVKIADELGRNVAELAEGASEKLQKALSKAEVYNTEAGITDLTEQQDYEHGQYKVSVWCRQSKDLKPYNADDFDNFFGVAIDVAKEVFRDYKNFKLVSSDKKDDSISAVFKFVEDEDEQFTELDSKQVLDSDGFLTDYTMYHDNWNDRWVFVFGDSEIYRPEDGNFDYEADNKAEADSWFRNYGEEE